jgi:predicted MFS family arabinose efflux permease
MTKRPLFLSLGGLLAMAAGIGIGRFVYTPILPPMVEALHLSKSQAGLIASANFIGYLAGALLAAVRLPGSRRAWLLGWLAVNAICLGAMGLTTSMPLFLLLRLVAGTASAFILIFSSALVLDRLASAGRSGLSAVHFAGVGIGIVASAALVGTLGDWRAMWIASGSLALLAGIAVAVIVPDDHPGPLVAARTAPFRLSPAFAALAAAYSLFGFGYIITATFIVALVRESSQIAALEPYIWVTVGLAAAPSVALWGRLGVRWGILNAFAAAALVEAIGVAVSVLWLTPASILLAAVFLGGTFMGLTALGLIAARETGIGDPRRRIALMTASFSAGQIVGPFFAGYAYDITGSLAMPSLVAVAALLVAALLAVVADAQRRGADRTASASRTERRPDA